MKTLISNPVKAVMPLVKKLIAFSAVLLIINSAHAGGNDASKKAMLNFSSSHSGVTNANWKISKNFSSASYNQDGINYAVFYDLEGNFICTKREFKFENLPMRAIEDIKSRFADYTVTETAQFMYDDDWAYYASIENAKETRVLKISPYGDVYTLKKIKH